MSIALWYFFNSLSVISLMLMLGVVWQLKKWQHSSVINSNNIADFHAIFTAFSRQVHEQQTTFVEKFHQVEKEILKQLHEGHLTGMQNVQISLQRGMNEVREQIFSTLQQNTINISQRIDKLTQETALRLQEISGQVDKRLAEGFEKTTATFTDVIKRLALIDEAQKKITELSSSVVSLQEILVDKRSRGTFGEVQLAALVRNMLPEQHFALQHTLSNGNRVDCILFLPEPTGNVSIDSKFPLESYRIMNDEASQDDPARRKKAEQQFRVDIRKHINDIATKYIVHDETAEGAIMFIPAEAIFAEIHGRFPDLVDESFRSRVWLASPTTLMAILTTARAVVKDAATRKQVHIIQQHLIKLAKDFQSFEKRMNNLAKHIEQAHQDVGEVNASAKKITKRFHLIEGGEIAEEKESTGLVTEESV